MKMKYENLVHHELLEHLDEESFECFDKYDVAMNPLNNYLIPMRLVGYAMSYTFTSFMKELHKDQFYVEVDNLKYGLGAMLTYVIDEKTTIYINSDMTYEQAKEIVLARKEAELLEEIVNQCLNNSKKKETL